VGYGGGAFDALPMTTDPKVAIALHGLVSNQLDRGRTLEQIRDQFFDADTDLELIEAFSEPEWLQSVLIEARAAQ
jgi:hypothetical protein